MNVKRFKTRLLSAASSTLLAIGLCCPSSGYAQSPDMMPRTGGSFEMPAGPTSPQRPSSWPGGNNQLPPAQGGPVQGARYPLDQANAAVPGGATGQTLAPVAAAPSPLGPAPVAQPGPINYMANRTAPQQQTVAPLQTNASLQPQAYEAGRQAARVGNEIILAGDVMAKVNEYIVTKKVPPEQWAEARELLFPQQLYMMIQEKQIVCDARRTIPKEAFPKIEAQVLEQFEKTSLPKLLKDEGVETTKDLEVKLNARGTSLAAQKRAFVDRSISQQWGQQAINRKKEIPVLQMTEYYRKHIADYQFPAKVRWEEIMVENANFPDKPQAFAAAAALGNEVLHGTNFAEVAKRGSQGTTAGEGGYHDWNSRGSLASEAIDAALFSLPVGSMSPIIESDRGFHIVRVIERKDAGQTPFEEVQKDIRKKLEEESYKKQVKEFLTKVRAKTDVWTMYDEKGGLAKILNIKDEDQ